MRTLRHISKISRLHRNIVWCSVFPPKWKFFSILAKTSWNIAIELPRIVLFDMKTRVCLKYFVHDCRVAISWIFLIFNFVSITEKKCVCLLTCSLQDKASIRQKLKVWSLYCLDFPFLYPLKTSAKQRFFDPSREYRNGSFG